MPVVETDIPLSISTPTFIINGTSRASFMDAVPLVSVLLLQLLPSFLLLFPIWRFK